MAGSTTMPITERTARKRPAVLAPRVIDVTLTMDEARTIENVLHDYRRVRAARTDLAAELVMARCATVESKIRSARSERTGARR